MMKLSQLIGIIWYEMRLQWRRRTMLVVILSFLSLMGFFNYLQYRSMIEQNVLDLPLDIATITVVTGLTPIGMLVMMLTLPPIVAETIPKDRQYGVDELLLTTPITSAIYLIGKVLGVWLSLTIMLVTIALVEWGMARLAFGPISMKTYLAVWLQGIVPLSFFASAMSLFLASRQPTRRRATMIGTAFTLYCLVTLPMIREVYTWPRAFIPNAWIQVMFHFMFTYLRGDTLRSAASDVLPLVPSQFVWRTIAAAAVQVVVVGLLTYGWWRFAEDRE
ncbi:MAG: hypothetical protein R3E31_27710 [Chloroflexota bacterium]